MLREAVEEAARHRLPVIAYCVLQYPSHALREHPDWRMRDRSGQPINHLNRRPEAPLLSPVDGGKGGFHP